MSTAKERVQSYLDELSTRNTLDPEVIQNLRPEVLGEISLRTTDLRALIAALEAVEALLDEKYELYAAICGETCVKEIHGVDHEAIADNIATNIRKAITEALQ